MIKRLPRYAEIELQRLCAKAGALCHAVDEDESGWDRLIEFPEKEFSGPTDMRPPRSAAYVQVKSVQKGAPKCRLKLSNALRAAQSTQPWFIVLVTSGKRGRPPKIYAVHFWNELIRRALEASRRAHNERVPLHKREITVRFQPDDERADGLVEWMQETIEVVGIDYEVVKRKINRTVGYEDGYGTGLLTVESKEEETLKNFLGLGDGLQITKFSFTSSRFGISSPLPEIEMSSGIIHITPEPAGEVEIRLRSQASSRTIVLDGHAYVTSLPGMPNDQKRYRFSAEFVEWLWGRSGPSDFNAQLNGGAKQSLATIEKYVALGEWLSAGPIDVQLWVKGRRAIFGTVNRKESREFDWPKLASALRLLRSIAGHENTEVSLNDIFRAPGLRTFSELAEARSLRLEFDPLPNMSTEPFTALIYWFHVDVADYVFCAMAEWPVVADRAIEGGKRCVTARHGSLVESYVLQNPSDSERQMIERDYERRRDLIAKGGVPMDLGDLRAFIAASAKE